MGETYVSLFNKIVRLTLVIIIGFFINGVAIAEPVTAKALEFWDDSEPQSRLKVNHSAWQAILEQYVDEQHPSGINRFDYSSVTDEDEQSLEDYIEFLQNYDPRQFNPQEQKAYWINLYNASIVRLILREKPGKSVKGIRSGAFTSGPWKRKLFRINDKKMTLNDIEHGILRPLLKDSRIHYALNVASLSCPNIQKQAYTGANVDVLLDQAARVYINHERAVRVNGKAVVLSQIYDWYRADFGGSDEKILANIGQYAEDDLNAQLGGVTDIEYDYDWSLNRP